MGILEQIKDIEDEMARTQKNKATEYHIGTLKARMARLRTRLIEEAKGPSTGKGEGFEVTRTGDARVAMIGFPSVGKSTLLSTLTNTESAVAAYAFTTLTCIPGVIHYRDSKIQLLDLPGIIEGAAKGKGRGRQVIAVGRSSDMVLMVLEASKAEVQRRLLLRELESVNIRVNKRPPDVTLRVKKTGGVLFNSTVELTQINERIVKSVLHSYKIHNAEVLVREDCSMDEFIDVVEGNRKYLRCLYLVNKIDTISLDEVDRLARLPHHVVVAANWKLNFDHLLAKMWEYLDLIRIFTKPKGKRPEFNEPLILPRNATIETVCNSIHRDFAKRFKYALVWGRSVKHIPQRVGLSHKLEDEDVVQLMADKNK